MSGESEVDKVLGRAGDLRKALGRPVTTVILLFALWTVRRRPGVAAAIISVAALLVTAWFKLRV
jgi:hypothetical protein